MAKEDYSGVSDQLRAGNQRLRDAYALLSESRWQGAMYLAGYAVECLLKARLMDRFRCATLNRLEEHLRQKRLLGQHTTVYSHQLLLLLRLSGSLDRLRMNGDVWRAFCNVNEWVPAWRYAPYAGIRSEAEEFLESVETVVRWLKANV